MRIVAFALEKTEESSTTSAIVRFVCLSLAGGLDFYDVTRALRYYMRCTMGESRLSSLALMYIKYDVPVDLDEIVNLFQGLHPRMTELSRLLNE